MKNSKQVASFIRSLPKEPSNPYPYYTQAKQWYERNVEWTNQKTYNRFIRQVCARIVL